MRSTLIPEGRGRGSQLCCEWDGLAVEVRPQDFSQAGVFIITTAPPALDDEIELLLRSPIGAIAVRGQVVQVITRPRALAERRQPGFGLLFVDLADDQRAWIGLSLDAIQRAACASTPAAARRDPGRDSAREEERQRMIERRQGTLDQLTCELAGLQHKAPWEILGLTAGADGAQARAAYLLLSKRYHPHVYAHLDSPEVSRAATELFIAHKRAYTTLASVRPAAPAAIDSDPPIDVKLPAAPRTPRVSLRAAAEPSSEPAGGARPIVSRAPGVKPASKPPSRRSSRPSKRAAASSSRAPQREPRDGSAAASPSLPAHRRRIADADKALQTGLKHLAASRFDDAVAELERAAELQPDRRDAAVWLHVCRARRHKAGGRDQQAEQEYRALLALDPEHREALDHVGGRSLRKRAGLIGKWFNPESE
jgi:curved DNA-binding protein CbpA